MKNPEPSGSSWPWKDPVVTTVIDLPVSRLVKVSVLPGNRWECFAPQTPKRREHHIPRLDRAVAAFAPALRR